MSSLSRAESKSRSLPLHRRQQLLPTSLTPSHAQVGSGSPALPLQRLALEQEALEELMSQLQAQGAKMKELLQAAIIREQTLQPPRPSTSSALSKGNSESTPTRISAAVHDRNSAAGLENRAAREVSRDSELDAEVMQEQYPSRAISISGPLTPPALRCHPSGEEHLGMTSSTRMSRSMPQLLEAFSEHSVHQAVVSSHPSFREASSPATFRSKGRLRRARTGDVRLATESRFQCLVVRPTSRKRVLWDILSTLVVLYDLFIIPFEAFTPPITSFTVFADWTTTIFWIVDMGMSSLTGYYEEGVLEMRPAKIIGRYLRSWFGVDALAVCGDTVILVLGFSVSAGSVLRVTKTARLVRVLRFLRLARLKTLHKALTELLDKVKSEYFRVVLQICFSMLTLLILNHYIACGWYVMGDWFRESTTWLTSHDTNDGGIAYWYMTSLHWSLTQFTPASMEVVATNTQERAFSVLVLLFALVAFSSFLSSITASMTYLRQLQKDALQQNAALRRYFLRNGISAELGQCILKYCRFQRTSKVRRRLHESEMPILSTLPEHIMVRVREELYSPDLEKHPFFEQYGHLCHPGMVELCHRAVSLKHVSAGQTIFIEGELATSMYFVTRHAMDYHHTMGHAQKQSQIEPGDWLAEPALWMSWSHCGRLLARDATECVEVHADACRKVLLADYHAQARDSVVTYARLYAELILSVDEEMFTDMSVSAFTLETLANAMRAHTAPEWRSEASTQYSASISKASKE